MPIKNLIDFRGGYCTDIPSELMAESELLIAENCQWRDGLNKRNGITKYSTTNLAAATGMRGIIRANRGDGAYWYSIIALDTGAVVQFYHAAAAALTTISASYSFTTGYNVEFAELNGKIIAVNGVDKPAIIYYDTVWQIKDLEAYDERTIEDLDWHAGQYTAIGTVYTDDTTNAQSTTAGEFDFQVCSLTSGDGCFIASDYTFTKVIFKSCQAAAGTVETYSYWNGSSWTALTVGTEPNWAAVEGDKTLEFDIPLDSDGLLLWEKWEETTDSYMANKYIIRIIFTTAPAAAFSCDYLVLSHTQYLTQIMQNERPNAVCSHGSCIHLAANNVINISPYNSVVGWRAGEVEYFTEGGYKIMQMVSYNDELIVFKENTIYSFTGNAYDTRTRSLPLANIGTVSARSAAMVGGYVFFVARDGIYAWNGTDALKISKHIWTDIGAATLTNTCGVMYQNEYWVSFPTNSIVLTTDPDSIRRDDAGDSRASFFKFTSYKVHQFAYCFGSGDSGYLLAAVDQATPYIARCDTGVSDNLGAAVGIDMKIQTKYFDFGNFQTAKYLGRVKYKIRQVSATAGVTHSLTIYSEDGTVSDVSILTATVGTGYNSDYISLPYTLDGKNISFYIRHNSTTSSGLIGYAIDIRERSF